MTVSAICNHSVATTTAGAGVGEAAELMRAEHVGDLIVVEHHQGRTVPVGIVTDRDIVVGVVAKGVDAATVRVGDIAGTELLTVREDNGVEFALREMRRAGVRRAPVINHEGTLVGVLSIDDVVDHLATQLGHIADIIRLEQQIEVDTRP